MDSHSAHLKSDFSLIIYRPA
ncbi:hypothetical protein HKBW3S42_02160, partial [Candidatus Hakubella thermalkaliphila]